MRLHIGIPWVGFLTCLCIGYAVSQDIPSLKVQLGRSESIAPIVDVGYARYQGSYNSTFNLNVYKGCAANPKSLIVYRYGTYNFRLIEIAGFDMQLLR